MEYESRIGLLNEEDFFSLFSQLGANPRWVISAGKRAIQLAGLCHGSRNSNSALFDPSSLKINCFSLCGGGMLLHTYVRRALSISPQGAKDFLEDWIDDQNIDLSNRVVSITHFEYKERAFDPTEPIEVVEGISEGDIGALYKTFEFDLKTLSKLTWCRDDGISADILSLFNVAYRPASGAIILPHHNIRGEIVGLYERSFKPLRKEIKKLYPEISWKKLMKYPRAKYVPLLREVQTEEKSSWSFPNSLNLYGLHLAAPEIKKTGKAIIFEGAKSVMLARQYGYPYAVATHTFGAHTNHIAMLIQQGAKEIIFAFDKQYQKEEGQAWDLYEKKTRRLAEEIGEHAEVSRLIDRGGKIGYKDAPIDCGKEIFEKLFYNREFLNTEKKKERKENSKITIPAEQLQEMERLRKRDEELRKYFQYPNDAEMEEQLDSIH